MSEVIAESGGEVAAADAGEAQASHEDILSAVGMLEAASPAEAAEAAPDEAEAEKTEPAKAAGKKKTRREFESFLMSETELAKPDGLKKAAEYWQKRQGALDGMDIRLKEKGEALAKDRQAAERWFAEESAKLEPTREQARRFLKLVERIEGNDLGDMLDALGEIRGKPGSGREVWERLARKALQNGKAPEPSRELTELREQVSRLEAMLRGQPEEQRKQTEAAELAKIQQRRAELADELGKLDPAVYPNLSKQAAITALRPAIVEEIRLQRKKAREAGSPIDIPTAMGRIEAALSKKFGAAPARGEPGKLSSETPRSPVAATVTSIAPSQARTSAVVREMTQEERDRDLAADTGFLSSLGMD